MLEREGLKGEWTPFQHKATASTSFSVAHKPSWQAAQAAAQDAVSDFKRQ